MIDIQNTPLAEFMIAGVRFRGNVPELDPDTSLIFISETDNKYDAYAVKIMATNSGVLHHMGYVPKHLSRVVAVLLAKNVPLIGRVVASDMAKHLCLVHLFVEGPKTND